MTSYINVEIQTQPIERRRQAPDAPAPPPRQTLVQQVEAAVIRDIRGAVYAAGTCLREERMSVRYGVSRTIIRSVLVRLAAGGYVELHPWRGAYITCYSHDELADLLDYHMLLMSFVARRAAVRRSFDDLTAMQRILLKLERLADEDDCSGFHLVRIAFTQALLGATGPLDSAMKRAAMTTIFYHQHWMADIANLPQRWRQVRLYRLLLAALTGQHPGAAAEHLITLLQEAQAAVLKAERLRNPA